MTEAAFLALITGMFGVVGRLFIRVNKLEKRLDEAIEKSGRVEKLLERVCNGYTAVRKELLKIARIVRNGGTISADHLDEIEQTPDIKELLNGDTNSAS